MRFEEVETMRREMSDGQTALRDLPSRPMRHSEPQAKNLGTRSI